MSVRGFNTGSGIEQYDYDYLDNKPAAPTKESIGLGNVDNTSDANKPVSIAQANALSQKVDKVAGMGLSQEDYTSAEKEKLEALPTNEELEADLAGKASAESVAALESAVNDPDNGLETKASAIINAASGAIASFSDGADSMPVKKLVVNVEPAQDLHGYDNPWPGGSGKNKLPPFTLPSDPVNGVRFTVDDYGVVTVNGTATSDAVVAITLDTSVIYGDYYFNGAYGGSDSTYNAYCWDGTAHARPKKWNGTTSSANGYQALTEVKIVQGHDVDINLRVMSGQTVSNVKFYPMICKSTETDPTFAPYSNVCPISGWTGAAVKGRGWNLLAPLEFYLSNSDVGTIVSADQETGSIHFTYSSGNRYSGISIFRGGALTTKALKPGKYTCSFDVSGTITTNWTAGPRRVSNNVFSGSSGFTAPGHYSFTFDTATWQEDMYICWSRIGNETTALDVTISNVMLTPGTTEAAFEPYTGDQISVTFPSAAGTVYGGTLTINPDRTGGLVVDRKMITVDGDTTPFTNKGGTPSYDEFYLVVNDGYLFGGQVRYVPTADAISRGMICNIGPFSYNVKYAYTAYVGSNGTKLQLRYRFALSDGINTIDQANEYAQNTPIQFVYPLASPITYQLTESEISGILETLYGTNNIWADCGDTTVEYTADTKLYIEQLTQPTEDDMTADHAISAGTFFMLGNTLYLATSQIAAGATITPGTNATKLSLADALNQLNV